MSANLHAYNTVFTVYSLLTHETFRHCDQSTGIHSCLSTATVLPSLSTELKLKLYNPVLLENCLNINHYDSSIRAALNRIFYNSQLVSFVDVLLIKHHPSNRKMRLGKPLIIAYIWHTMHDAVKDEQLMLQYKDGDSRAFEVLYSRYRLPMFRYLQNQCGNAAIAEEIFQDVWMNLVRARERYQVTASFKTYIYRLAHNRLIDHYRKQKHGVPSSYDEHEGLLNMDETANHISPQRHVAVEQQVDKLLDAIAQLPEAQREAFLLKEETGLSVEEIAVMTDVKPETAKSRIRYAMNKLKEAVEIEQYG